MNKHLFKHISILVIGIVIGGAILPSIGQIDLTPVPVVTRWDKAFQNIIKEEGGYTNNPSDPGGETKWGISKTSFPHIDIKQLTKAQAELIYKTNYWNVIQGDAMTDDMLAVEVMEEAVNMGTVTAIKFLQTAIMVAGGKVDIDGKMGPHTIEELHKFDPKIIIACIKAQSMSYYMSLVHHNPALRKFLKGWFNRVLD